MNPSKDTERNEAMLESTKPRGGEPCQCPEAKLAQILTAGDVLDVMKMSRLDMQSRSRSYRKKRLGNSALGISFQMTKPSNAEKLTAWGLGEAEKSEVQDLGPLGVHCLGFGIVGLTYGSAEKR